MGIEVGGGVGRVGPDRFLRAVIGAGGECVTAVGVYGRNDFLDRRVISAGAPAAVVEDEDVPLAGQAGLDPLGVVLDEELLIGGGSGVVGLRVAPTVEQVAARAGGFGGGGAVIDDPDLPEVVHAEDDLVQLGAVIDRVGVVPVGPAVHDIVQVDQFGMVGHHAVVVLGGVVVLNQVVPGVPLPDDIAGGGTGGMHLDDAVGPQFAIG